MTDYQNMSEKEAAFHDRVSEGLLIKEDFVQKHAAFDSPAPYMSLTFPRLKARLSGILGDVAGKHVLVYGCGSDSAALWFARAGAVVDAIDISPKSVENQKMIAQVAQVSINCLVRDAHRTDLLSEYYDIIYGNAILHHLTLELAIQEIHRLLKPGGMAVFRDVMKGNVFLRMFRVLTPFWRTPDEHPLTDRDLKLLEEKFSSVDVGRYALTSLPLTFFRRILNNVVLKHLRLKFRIPRPMGLYAMLDRIDGSLFELLPFLKSQAWICLVTLWK